MIEKLKDRGHAVVIGGSIAGMLAARVLLEHFEKVTVIERDSLPDIAASRRGVPQARHAHAILAGGYRVLEKLYPEISNELRHMGAFPADALAGGNWYFEDGLLDRTPLGISGMLSSRLILEQAVRRLTLQDDRIELIVQDSVRELVVENGRVKGVATETKRIAANLVVDCTGRGSHAPKWLEALGYPAPRVDEVNIQLVYTTRRFRRGADGPDIFSVVPPTPEGKRGGVLLAQENREWICTLFGHFGEQAPGDHEGFLEYAKSLPGQCIYDAIAHAEPIGDATVIRFPTSVRRRYEKLDNFPEGFLILGDAICSFNPIYGQGMSVAALEAEALGEALSGGMNRLAKRFFRAAARIIDNPWNIAVGNDLKMPEVPGPKPLGVRFINWYVSKLHKCGHRDAAAAHAFIRVQQLLDPPESILHPRVVARVFLHSIGLMNGNKAKSERAIS